MERSHTALKYGESSLCGMGKLGRSGEERKRGNAATEGIPFLEH